MWSSTIVINHSLFVVFRAGYTLDIKTCSHASSGSPSASSFTVSSSDGAMVSQFLVSPSSPGTLYRVGSDPEESAANWTSLDITTSSNDALCIEYIVVDDEVWVGSTWLDNPCDGEFSPCVTSYTWYRVSNPPSGEPSGQPSDQPSAQPSNQPSDQPTGQPSHQPSAQPSNQPSDQPTGQPSDQPSAQPSNQPSHQPTGAPSGTRGAALSVMVCSAV